MAKMGKYCKAYPLKQFRAFSQWFEQAENTRKEKQEINGQEVEVKRELTDKAFLYLQENYMVTDGIFIDENIIFDQVTPAWQDFCKATLKFETPVYESVNIASSASEESEEKVRA